MQIQSQGMQEMQREWHGGHTNGDSEGNTSSNKTCNFCGLKGHKEAGCFKKFPKKALAWYKEKNAETKTASSSVEVSLASVDPEKLGITYLQYMEKVMTCWPCCAKKTCGFVILMQDPCDME